MNEKILLFTTIGILIIFAILTGLIKLARKSNTRENQNNTPTTPDEVYNQIKIYIANNNHPEAQKIAIKYLKQNPNHDKIRTILARSCYDTSELIEAIKQLEILVKTFPERKDLYVMLANSYKRTNQNSLAIETYLSAMEHHKNDENLLCSLAETYNSINNKQLAIDTYKTLLSLNTNENNKRNYYYQTALLYKDINNFKKAIEYLDFALKTDSNNINILKLYRTLAILLKKPEKEIEVATKLLDLTPNDIQLKIDIIELYFQTKQYEEALNLAYSVPENSNIDKELLQEIIAMSYIKTNRYKEGIKVLQAAVQEHPDSINLNESLANTYNTYGHYEEATELYQKLVDKSDIIYAKAYTNKLSSVYCDWALHMYNTGKTDEAFAKFEEALMLNPDNPDIYVGLGHINFYSKNYNDAIREMQKAIELDPNNCSYYTFLADIYYATNNLLEAEKMHKEAIFIDAENPISHAKLGLIHLENQNLSGALEHLTAAVHSEPENWDYLYHLALVYEYINKKDKAIETYRKILAIYPQHTEAMDHLKLLEDSK